MSEYHKTYAVLFEDTSLFSKRLAHHFLVPTLRLFCRAISPSVHYDLIGFRSKWRLGPCVLAEGTLMPDVEVIRNIGVGHAVVIWRIGKHRLQRIIINRQF